MVEFKQKILSNGLTILHEKRDVSVTTMLLGVKYGSRYETEEEKGIAHFIEHLCFKGTEKRTTKQVAEEIENIGGNLNAFTSEEVTAYHAKFPSESLEKVGEVLFDIFFNPTFPEEEVKKEAEVICEEIKMYYDNPRARALDMIKTKLYEKPFGMFIGGTQEIVRGLTREKLLEKHRNIYSPENSVLVVVGNNSFEEVVSLAEKFVVERKGQKIEKPKIDLKNSSEKEKRDSLQQVNLCIGFHFPIFSDRDWYASQVFSSILGEGMSSKLFTEVREKRGLVYGIKAEIDSGKDYSYFFIWAGTDSSNEEKVKELSLKEFEKMKDLTEDELETAKRKLIGGNRVDSESSDDVARDLLAFWSYGNAEEYYRLEENLLEVRLEDIKKLAHKQDFSFYSVGP
jgi:predicted Zn-dependent peptidase